MNARLAAYGDTFDRRVILAVEIFRWTVRLGFAIAPRDMSELRQSRRRRARSSDVPPYLRADVGLPPEEENYHLATVVWHMVK